MSTTPTQTEQRTAARDSGRHPAGRAMRHAVVTLAAAGMLAAAPGAASAHETGTPHPHSQAEANAARDAAAEAEPCGPGFYPREAYGYCKQRTQLNAEIDENDDLGRWALAILGVAALAAFG